MSRSPGRVEVVWRIVVAWAVLAWASAAQPASAQELKLIFFNVGQGDAALLETPDHRTMLIDAGRSSAPVLAYLQSRHIDTVDLVVISHNHDDHMGGMPDLLNAVAVRNYMDNGVPSARLYGRYIAAIQASGARYLRATPRTITLGAVRVRVLAPPDDRLSLLAADQNNHSVGLLIEYGRFRALLTGDSQREELGYWLETDSLAQVAVLKVAHHGSDNGTTPEWVARMHPAVAVISVGNNGYGHPSAGVLSQWCGAGAMVLRTDEVGSVVVRADTSGQLRVTTLPDPALRSAATSAKSELAPLSACGGRR